MHRKRKPDSSTVFTLTTLAAAALLAACGSDNGVSAPPAAPAVTLAGVVVASGFTPGSAGEPNLGAGYYQSAVVCIDANGNGKCDSGEVQTTTGSKGEFSLVAASSAALIADIGTGATNSATGAKLPSRLVLRAAAEQVTESGGAIVISALSSEVQRTMEADASTYAVQKQNLAARLGMGVDKVLTDINGVPDAGLKSAMLTEANALANRFAYAITKLDRGDLFPEDRKSVV